MTSSTAASSCLHCGGLIMEPGKVYGWAGKVCYCGGKNPAISPFPTTPLPEVPKTNIPTGWLCPVCGTVHAPAVYSCPHRHLP